MKLIDIRLEDNPEIKMVGYIHSPITEMETHRKSFPAIVICPGGGYQMLSEREADPVAFRYLSAGYNVFIVYYSINEKARGFRPLRDVSDAIVHIREHAEEYLTDPEKIAVCGFSAGGHLAASAGTLWNNEKLLELYDNKGGMNRPNAMILCYPVILANEFAHEGSIKNVSGAEIGTEEYEFFSLEKHVGEHTPPAFIWHTVEDSAVPVENSLAMIAALQKSGISYEAHLFPTGAHGMSIATAEVGTQDDYNARWIGMSIAWLNKTFEYTP